MKNKFIRKILALFMVAGASIGLTGCDNEKYETNQNRIFEIRDKFEYDADYDINLNQNLTKTLKLETTINEGNHILNFQFYQESGRSRWSANGLYYEVYFVVDKDTYFDFKKNFNSDHLEQEDVEMVHYLVENYDPYKINSHIAGEEDWTNDEPNL